MTPTQRTLKALRKQGIECDVAEYWNSFARKRRDLFRFIDIVALQDRIVGIQCTSGSNVAARVTKIISEFPTAARAWLASGGRLQVWGWRKLKRGRVRWEPRVEEITLEQLRTPMMDNTTDESEATDRGVPGVRA